MVSNLINDHQPYYQKLFWVKTVSKVTSPLRLFIEEGSLIFRYKQRICRHIKISRLRNERQSHHKCQEFSNYMLSEQKIQQFSFTE